ncbi:mannosidase MsdS [Ascobolus immersus RN42]|uniref:alpha-1,2-Mannosidase n=1 Tax=Ascobolus immersus RN42 TaxID=1160509 RepID=A0A3N4IID2_ASCIM|nr:mannosidase MsdS [Ascobolus immersus RN42]
MRLPLLSLSLTLHLLPVFSFSLFSRSEPDPVTNHTLNALRKSAIISAFNHSWTGYTTYAWGHDDLLPLSQSFSDSRNGWGATIIDSLDTAIIMNLPSIVWQQLAWIKTVDFTQTKDDEDVSLFETTIRYLGGMLAAHDLLEGPYNDLLPAAEREYALTLLKLQSKSLADSLSYAFSTPSCIPHNHLKLNHQSWLRTDRTTMLAQAGTLLLEWTRLSDLLSLLTYTNLTLAAESHLLNPVPINANLTVEPFPGLLGTTLSIRSGKFLNAHGGWGAETDSYYEYLLKTSLYSPSRFPHLQEKWMQAVDSSIHHLLAHPSGHPEVTMLGQYYKNETDGQGSHLACFAGGNWILGGYALKNNTILDYGEKLTEGCHYASLATKTGLAPEQWLVDAQTHVSPREAAFVKASGFRITNPSYSLRPEIVESYYYGLVLTGKEKYREWAWEAFQSMEKECKVATGGYAGIEDVNIVGGMGMDIMESFWMGETLKYLFLIFEYGDGERVSVKPEDGWVFTTEAHPLKIVG